MSALSNTRVIANCKTLSACAEPGDRMTPMDASRHYRRMYLDDGAVVTRDRVGGQTIAAILVKYCGWRREGRMVVKPGITQRPVDMDAARKVFADASARKDAPHKVGRPRLPGKAIRVRLSDAAISLATAAGDGDVSRGIEAACALLQPADTPPVKIERVEI